MGAGRTCLRNGGRISAFLRRPAHPDLRENRLRKSTLSGSYMHLLVGSFSGDWRAFPPEGSLEALERFLCGILEGSLKASRQNAFRGLMRFLWRIWNASLLQRLVLIEFTVCCLSFFSTLFLLMVSLLARAGEVSFALQRRFERSAPLPAPGRLDETFRQLEERRQRH